MQLITRDTDYAIRALCFIAESRKERVAVAELVKRLGIPRPFLRKILQVLTKKKFLNSYRGQAGGFSLAVSPAKITLIDLVEAFQGRLRFNKCIFKKQVCPNMKVCKVKRKIDSIQKFVVSELKGVTIASLLNEAGSKKKRGMV